MKLGKQRPPRARSCDSGSDTSELLDRRDSSCTTSNEPSRTNSMTSLETNVSDYDSQGGTNTVKTQEAIVKPTKKSKPKVRSILRTIKAWSFFCLLCVTKWSIALDIDTNYTETRRKLANVFRVGVSQVPKFQIKRRSFERLASSSVARLEKNK